ncbi:efflux RND transporter periplasmic adaptor subunit [Chitinophaga rhizophila]|uniref:Efflux RND transporter periplasmic adaptor subunit n=1 Tax=Chitinophaga rhizophila TaxID=2866212 RepID=A0ABS7G7J8_9BACT|nr:efflux RND transporter periplasmic adaptor subunit [Chitinophaga rhizophila]MBW8683371.1 efflux RND transporter periplasmic adaptor subunit [Chitinophaga rhizophila]
MSNNRMPVLITSFLAWVIINGCQSGKANESAAQAMPTPELPVLTLDTATALTAREYAAILEGKENVDIRAQVNGYLEKVYVEEGSFVRQGQPLFKINDRPYQAQLEKDVASLHAMQSAEANAALEVEKMKPLAENKVVSAIQLKTAQTSLQTAKANVEQAKAAIAAAQVNVGFTVIKAPVSGYIGRIPKRTGNLVSATDATPLTTLSDISKIYAYFSMSENDFIRFSKGAAGTTLQQQLQHMRPVSLVLSNGEDFSEKGRIEMVDGQFNRTTAAISVRATFPNPAGVLRSGNTGKVRIEQLMPGVVLIPQSATMELQDKIFVYQLVDSNKVRRQPIITAGTTEDNFIVVDGVKSGDRIVTAGMETITEGTVIKPVAKK